MPRDATEHTKSAKAAGLQYVTEASPGITRKRAGKGFRYLDPEGRRIADRDVTARIEGLVIPPAWTDVWICPRGDGHIQATGRDAKRRKQYRYHTKYRAIRDETKFERILEFSQVLPRMRKQIERDLSRSGLPREKILAAVLRLLEATLIRVGNDEYARDNKSYGLTTLKGSHAAVEGWKVKFDFRGKSGVEHAVSITDGRLARIVQHCQTLPGEELFKYFDEKDRCQVVDSGDINSYLADITGGSFTAKDIRTWTGTVLAAAALRDLGVADTEKQKKANILACIDAVAERLGNTRAVCRKYYIHPKVIELYMSGRVIDAPARPEKHARKHNRGELRRDEVELLKLLGLHGGASNPGTDAHRQVTDPAPRLTTAQR
ncbi:MAG: DNA topoisomerase IB [Gemmatimonadetes bacterium]|nr:DNA topoisomerase IB [Gemmatimonadota bacterium]